MTFETRVTFLTIENLNSWQSLLPDNQEWHGTAFAILAMFILRTPEGWGSRPSVLSSICYCYNLEQSIKYICFHLYPPSVFIKVELDYELSWPHKKSYLPKIAGTLKTILPQGHGISLFANYRTQSFQELYCFRFVKHRSGNQIANVETIEAQSKLEIRTTWRAIKARRPRMAAARWPSKTTLGIRPTSYKVWKVSKLKALNWIKTFG